MTWVRFEKGDLSLLSLARSGNLGNVLNSLEEYTLEYLNTPGVLQGIVEWNIQFRNLTEDERDYVGLLAYHIKSGDVQLLHHNQYRCGLTFRGPLKNRGIGYEMCCNKKGMQYDKDMNNALVNMQERLGCAKIGAHVLGSQPGDR
jgi:hypothetical protein